MNERDLRLGFEDDGMSESEIERALDQHEAALLDAAIEEAVPVYRIMRGEDVPIYSMRGDRGTSSLLLAAAMGAASIMGRQRAPYTPGKVKYSVPRQKQGAPGSKLARKAAKGKL